MSQNCRLCNGSKLKTSLKKTGLEYKKCHTCGILLQQPIPDTDNILSVYNKSFFEYELNNQDNFYNMMLLGLKSIKFDTLYNKPGKVLDIGSATGKLLNHFKIKGWDTLGIEINHDSANYARKNFNLDIIEKRIEDVELETDSIDFIHSSHVIEHVESPLKFLSTVYKILKPNGYALITTPNTSSLQFHIYKNNWRSALPSHLQLFAKKDLIKLCKQLNFTIIKQISWGGIPIEAANNHYMKYIKYCIDKTVKLLNIGDVMLLLLKK